MLFTKHLKDFYYGNHIYSPFGKGPWPCLNPAHSYYRKKVIRKVKVTTCSTTKGPVGIFSCSCGFEYSRSGPDKDESDQFRRNIIINFGPIWKEKLVELSSQELSTRKVALKLGVDSKTVKSQLMLINTEKTQEKVVNPIELNNKRKVWINLTMHNPELSVTELRELNNAVYMWLYRNDKQWLSEVSNKKEREKVSNERVDWQQRDSDLLNEIKEIITNWKKDEIEKPIKITKTRIASKTLRPYLIMSKGDKIPNLMKYIETVIETDEQFRLRRIDWAFEILIVEGKTISKWMLLRKAEFVRSL